MKPGQRYWVLQFSDGSFWEVDGDVLRFESKELAEKYRDEVEATDTEVVCLRW